MRDLPIVPLIQRPTPLHRLDRLSERLGIDLWIKRDDLSGFALGGNKGRKLEYLIAEALAAGADAVVSCGSSQSNFVRQLGAACSVYGLRCGAAVMDLPYEHAKPQGTSLLREAGNVLLDRMLGVDLRFHPDATWEELYAQSEALAQEYEAQGLQVHRVPVGGSSPVGAFAFYRAAKELVAQDNGFDYLLTSSSSGSTQTGLAYGLQGSRTQVIGISADQEPGLPSDFAELCEGLHDLAGEGPALTAADFDLRLDWVGPGYGVPSEAGDAAIKVLATSEGIFLDPIYSGKAFAGLLDLAERGEIKGRAVFWHTGGIPTLFAQQASAG